MSTQTLIIFFFFQVSGSQEDCIGETLSKKLSFIRNISWFGFLQFLLLSLLLSFLCSLSFDCQGTPRRSVTKRVRGMKSYVYPIQVRVSNYRYWQQCQKRKSRSKILLIYWINGVWLLLKKFTFSVCELGVKCAYWYFWLLVLLQLSCRGHCGPLEASW